MTNASPMLKIEIQSSSSRKLYSRSSPGPTSRPPCRRNVSRRYMEQAPERQAIASTTSSMDRTALIDIRYLTHCSPVHIDYCTLFIELLQLETVTCGTTNMAARQC